MKDPHVSLAPRAQPQGSLVVNVVEFCRLLRTRGLPVPPGSAAVALRCLREIDVSQRTRFRAALRLCLLQRPEHIPLFNDLFAAYWHTGTDPAARRAGGQAPSSPPDAGNPSSNSRDADAGGAPARQRARRLNDAEHGDSDASASRAAPSGLAVATAAADNDRGSHELDRIGHALARELAVRRSRRKSAQHRGPYLDARKLLRNSVRQGGFPIELRWRRAKITRARLVVFCDVSRSMEVHAQLLLRFAAAVLRHAWRVEVFLFASELRRVTDSWLESEWLDLTRAADGLRGGTRIGHCLSAFLEDYGYCLGGGASTLLVLSDGLDADDPAILSRAMARLQRQSRQIIWLNPLLTTRGYEPTARGMAAALPHVDVFAAADGIESLWQLVGLLRRAA